MNNRIITSILVVTMMLNAITAQASEGIFSKRIRGNGNKIIETRQSAMQFTEVSVSTCIHLVISDRRDGDILVRTDENIMPYVHMEVHNGVFRASLKNTSARDMENVRIDIEMPYNGKIREINAAAASSVTVVPTLEADEMELSATGASFIVANVRAKSVDVDLTGASSARLTVETSELDITASGASKTRLESATCNSCDLEATGASQINGKLFANTCDIEASGASKISLSGSTLRADIEISGASKCSATEFIIDTCEVEASGASAAYVHCTNALTAEATGSSKIGYSGNCRVNIASDSIFKQN